MTPIREYLMIGKLLALLAAIALICWQSSQIHRWHTHYISEHAAHERDINAYRAAQAQAEAANLAQIAKVKAEQERITGNVERSYESDLARLRVDLAQRLRQQAAKGASGNSAAPGLPNAAPVLDDPSRVSIPTGLYVRGAELELQLERLQDWVRQQVAVDPNK
jgi:hypothetical protein